MNNKKKRKLYKWVRSKDIDHRLSPSAFDVLMYLASHADEDYTTYTIQKEIAKEIKVHKGTVALAIRKLKEAELITVTPQVTPKGHMKSLYHILYCEELEKQATQRDFLVKFELDDGEVKGFHAPRLPRNTKEEECWADHIVSYFTENSLTCSDYLKRPDEKNTLLH